MFTANQKIDRYALEPIAEAYLKTVPEGVRNSLRNATANLGIPVTLANDLLQGKPSRAAQSLYRFGINSTVGVGGLFDVAADWGDVAPHKEDFGQTLGVYGVTGGPYLVLPLLGSSNVRDTVGYGVDVFLDPTTYIAFHGKTLARIGVTAVSTIDRRARNISSVEGIERSSMDLYAVARSYYDQRRESDIHDGAAPTDNLPDF